ncbi:peptidase M50 [Mycobacterium sp.]|uniref:peptidase M50 n=1 Tax=Mycobacterium sp. TaxID=1785 RepID=UPI003A8C1517
MKAADRTPATAVLVFGDARLPRALSALETHRNPGQADIDAAAQTHRRLVVAGDDTHLAQVLTRLLRTERLDVEVGYVPRRRTHATRAYRLPAGRRAVRRALRAGARRVPLIRDETGTAIVGRARWLPAAEAPAIRGEAVVDDTVLFDGDVAEVWIEPTALIPGLRAALPGRFRWTRWTRSVRWVGGRAAQLGTTGAVVVRDEVPGPRTVRRSTFYRNVEGWLLVR